MKAVSKKGGYSASTAKEYISLDAPIYSLTSELEPRYEYVEGRPTQNVIAYSAWFVQEGTEPFKVRFESQIKLPPFLSPVTFDGLEGVVVRNNVYFRAKNVTEIH
ncbi:hypothetical protein ABPH35_08370 [Streptococcus sp. ZJ93]|uniref:hypothetical protein n=1 Tax=Streptococcus handemini TaxID=3161188 RepID=UPI0032EC3D44